MKKILLTTVLIMSFIVTQAQSSKEDKMKKDLEVAENVLASMISSQSSNRFISLGNKSIESQYRKGYGVIFRVSQSSVFGLIGRAEPVQAYNDARILVTGQARKNLATTPSELEGAIVQNIEEREARENEKVNIRKEVFIDFLANYATLIRGLGPDEKIRIEETRRNRNNDVFWVSGQNVQKHPRTYLSLEVLKKDLNDYESGSLTLDALKKKMTVKDIKDDGTSNPQLEIFRSAFQRMYSSDLSDTYYMIGSPEYEEMEGYGVTFHLKYYSSQKENQGFFLPTVQETVSSRAERDQIVNDMYAGFLVDLKENILEYGRILKNLKQEDLITFDIELTECDGCDMPSDIIVTVKKSIIDKYHNGQMSLDEAVKNINVEES